MDEIENRSERLKIGSIPLGGSIFTNIVKDMTTSRQQIIIIPAFSIVDRAVGNLQIRFRLEGIQQSISSGTKNKRQAEAEAKTILTRWLIAHGKSTTKGKTPLQAEIDTFIESQYRDLKPSTRTEAVLVLRRFANCFPVAFIQDLTPEIFRNGIPKLRGEAAPKYWSNILAIVRKFSLTLFEHGKIIQDFTKGVAMPPRSSFKVRTDVWTEEEFDAAIIAVNPFDAEILRVMLWTGMDSADVYELRRKHFVKDEEGNWVIRKRREKGKSEQETILQPIGSKALPILIKKLDETKHPEDRLFKIKYKSSHSFTSSLLTRVKRATAKTGHPLKNLKALRHTYITYHAERGVPLDVLRQWVGHTKDSRTLDRVYLHRASTSRFMD